MDRRHQVGRPARQVGRNPDRRSPHHAHRLRAVRHGHGLCGLRAARERDGTQSGHRAVPRADEPAGRTARRPGAAGRGRPVRPVARPLGRDRRVLRRAGGPVDHRRAQPHLHRPRVAGRAAVAARSRSRVPRLAWINAGEALVWGFTTLLGALLGLGFWALVLGAVVSSAAVTVVLSMLRPHHLSWPRDVRSIANAIHLGWYIVVSQLCWYVYSHADLTIVGRVLGKAPLGAYTKGWDIASVPTDRISTLVGQVTPAVFSAAQKDQVALRRYLLALTEGLALLTFPLSVGLALVADLFVITVLGEQWRAAIVPVRLLGLYGGFRAIFNTLPQMLVATGHAKENMRFNLFAAVAVPTAVYIGSRRGATRAGLAWIVGYPLITIPTFFPHTLRILDLRPSAYLRALWPAATAAAGIAVAVLLPPRPLTAAWAAG